MTTIERVVTLFLLTAGLASAEILNKGWWRNTVFYQVYPRSFMDSNNDGIGDLAGITSKLSHFQESGIEAIWLSPINQSPMVDFGYDISDFTDIAPEFGTLEDFKKLTQEAKKLGIKVILDLVPNHTSDEHHWFNSSAKGIGKYKDYYIWRDGKNKDNKTPPNNWLSVFGGSAWTYNDTRKQWYFHQFHWKQPDLNYANPEVQEEMERIITYWLDKGVDGFRIDAVPHIFETNYDKDEPKSNTKGVTEKEYAYLDHIYTKDHPDTYKLIQSWRNLVDNYANLRNQSEKVIMTEAYTNLENTTLFYNYGANVPFNFKFIMEVNSTSSAQDFKRIIDEWIANTPKDQVPNWVMGNHDRSRTATRYSGKGDHMTMLEMILPGVAVTYYGEEIGMVDKSDITWEATQDPQGCQAGKDKYKTKSRDPCRTPFQWNTAEHAGFSKTKNVTWLPVNSNYKTLNLDIQKNATESHYKLYQALTKMRKSSDALKDGTLTTTVLSDDNVLAVVRTGKKEIVTLLINFSKNNVTKLDVSTYVKGSSSTVKLRNVGSKVELNKPVTLSGIQIPGNDAIIVVSTVSGAMSIFGGTFNLILITACLLLFRA